MKTSLKATIAAGIGFGGLGLAAAPASSMPAGGLNPVLAIPADLASRLGTVRWVCETYGNCHWVRTSRRYWWGPGYGFYAPGPWWRYGYGYFCPWPGPYGWDFYC